MEVILETNPKLKIKSDIMFKAFFGRKENEEFLQDFLEAILEEKIKIKGVIHDARLEQLAKEQKYGILDLGVELEEGEFINVEIQLRNYENIEERTTFYASKKITEQLNAGEDYRELKPVIIIAILDYEFIDLPEYVTETVRVAVRHREYELNNDVKYYYVELSKFRKQNPDMKLPINQWLSFLDMERGDLLEMAKKENKKVKKALENYEVLTGDEEVKRLAEIKLMSDLEERAALASARDHGHKEGLRQGHEEGLKQGHEEGLKQGHEEGLKQGHEEGLKQGHEEGVRQGQKDKQIEIAKKLLKLKLPIKQIVETTGISEEELAKI